MADQSAEVILGVDTHAQVHVACLLDQLGRPLGTLTIPVTTAGFHQLVAWASRHGRLIRAGVEGTGTYGAGLTRHLTRAGITVVKVDRPNRQRRRRRGKSDPIDAEAAARAVLADEATTTPRPAAGSWRPSGCCAWPAPAPSRPAPRPPTSSAICCHRPEELHTQLYPLSTAKRVQRLVAQQLAGGADPASATHRALCHLARRHQALTAELAALNADLVALTRQAAPRLLARCGIGIETAGQLLVTAGGHPDRLRSDAALAALCGASPVAASSGKTVRHRLNRGGDRQATAPCGSSP
jgi:transposase